MCAKSLSHVQHFVAPWTVARQAALSMGFSREEYWSELPCPPPRHHPNPGIEIIGRRVLINVDNIKKETNVLNTKKCIMRTEIDILIRKC